MRTNHRQNSTWTLVRAVEEFSSSHQQSLYGFEEFTMSDFPAKMPPQHLDGVKPWAIGGKVEQDESACCRLHHRIHFLIFMGIGIVPGHVDRPGGMFLHQGRKQLSHFLTSLVTLELHDGFASEIIDGSNPVIGVLLPRRCDHDLLPHRAPHRP